MEKRIQLNEDNYVNLLREGVIIESMYGYRYTVVSKEWPLKYLIRKAGIHIQTGQAMRDSDGMTGYVPCILSEKKWAHIIINI